MIHYAPHTATTSCGIPLETPGVGAFSDERDLVAGCLSCAKAAAAVPTSCASCGYTYCECFEAGYAAALASRLRRRPPQPQQHRCPICAPAPPQPQAAADTDAPICGRCGVHRVGRRRNGSYFNTCYDCGG